MNYDQVIDKATSLLKDELKDFLGKHQVTGINIKINLDAGADCIELGKKYPYQIVTVNNFSQN